MASARSRLARWRTTMVDQGYRIGVGEEIAFLCDALDLCEEQVERLYFALHMAGVDEGDSAEAWENRIVEPTEPRRLPAVALLGLGMLADDPDWLPFLIEAKELGFGLDQDDDWSYSDEKWVEVAMLRVRTLTSAFRRRQDEPTGAP